MEGLTLPPMNEEDTLRVQERLWSLLTARVKAYTQGDSASLPVEKAEALYDAVCYVLKRRLDDEGMPVRTLLTASTEDLFAEGVALLRQDATRAQALYRQVADTSPRFVNRAYHDTVESIPTFFRFYDPLTFAQAIPCDIDYPLCQPVTDDVRGVAYLLAYLSRLLLENTVVNRCDDERVERLLRASCPEPAEQLINVFEIVMTNAIGAALTGDDVAGLSLGETARHELNERLMDAKTRRVILATGAKQACLRLKLPQAEAYCTPLVAGLDARIGASSADRVFLSLAPTTAV